MARWQAFHRQRCEMHLGHIAWQDQSWFSAQSPQSFVSQLARGHDRWRLSGHVSPSSATASVYRITRLRGLAGLPLPRHTGPNAAAPDWYRTFQVHRIQAERVNKAGSESGLLERGASLP